MDFPLGDDPCEENAKSSEEASEEGPQASAGNEPGKPQDDSPREEASTETNVEPIQKEKSVSKSIRLWKSALDALKVLMGKYGKNMVDMASIAIIAHAKQAAAAATVRFRLLDDKTLFALQASATDIRAGLSNLRNDLYTARKSNRDPEQLKAAYAELRAKYKALTKRADEILTLIDKEITLHGLLGPSDYALLIQAIAILEASKPKTRTQTQLRDLLLRIYKTLLH